MIKFGGKDLYSLSKLIGPSPNKMKVFAIITLRLYSVNYEYN